METAHASRAPNGVETCTVLRRVLVRSDPVHCERPCCFEGAGTLIAKMTEWLVCNRDKVTPATCMPVHPQVANPKKGIDFGDR
eukprot:3980863-Alexandrium_andersonii.AAC.1